MTRPRILVLTPTFPPTFGGIQVLTHRVVAGWQRLDARVVTLDSPGAQGFDARQAYAIRRVSRPALSHRLAIVALNVGGLSAALRWRPHAVLSCHITTAPAARLASAMLRVPYVQWVYAKEIPARPRLARLAVAGAAVVIAVSRHSADLVRALGTMDVPIRIVPPGVELPSRDPSAAAERAIQPTVLFVARLRDRHKGLDVLIRAMPAVATRIPGSMLVVVGDGPLRGEYERIASDTGVADIVAFQGAVSDEERDRWLDRAHVFAMPSRHSSGAGGEGFGIAYLEASAHGLPIVAGNFGGALDAVEHGVTGLLVDPTESTQVADAVASVLADPVLARRMGDAGRSRAAASPWARTSGQVERILLGVLVERDRRDGRSGGGSTRKRPSVDVRPARPPREVVPETGVLAGRRVPDFFIVGAPRSGTTSLYEALKQHPAIYLPDAKEPHFLAPDLDSGSYQDSLYFVRDLDTYLSLFAPARPDQLTGEGSTSYLLSSVAARNIHRLNPDARIVIMLRDPADMLPSFHRRRLFSGAEDIERFEDALAAEEDRRRGLRIPAHARNIPALFYRDVGRYAEQVGRFLATFPREKVLFIIFDDLRADALATYRRTARFLGVDPTFEPQVGIENASRSVRSRRVQHMLLSPALIRVGRAVLPAAMHHRVRPLVDVFNARRAGRSKADAALRSRLHDEFRADVARLGDMVGRDLVALWSY
jgi:phosphatidyl-myo-inositol dimannoside synthase